MSDLEKVNANSEKTTAAIQSADGTDEIKADSGEEQIW